MSDFAGKTVVVTGGAGALGTAVVALLLERGARVHVPVRTEEERARVARDPQVVARIAADLAAEQDVARFYAEVPELWASIHVAGGYAGGPLLETSAADAARMLSMNAMTAWLCSREAVRRIRSRADASGGGRIVNVAAKPALVPMGGLSAYAMSKAAVAGLTTSLAEELRDERIWVNVVVPSVMATAQNRAAMPSADQARWPDVTEVAETVVFLASPENRVTRGALVPVFGRS